MTQKEKVGPAPVTNYRTFLVDKYRPPSKGGNTRAWHQHTFEIDSVRYSFLALGAKKWVFAKDVVEFEWEWDKTNKYCNVLAETVQTLDRKGQPVIRGERGGKKWRTAPP